MVILKTFVSETHNKVSYFRIFQIAAKLEVIKFLLIIQISI